MKTVKKNVLSIIALGFITYCCNPADELRLNGVQPQNNEFHLEAQVLDAPFYGQNAIRLEFTEGIKCNLSESIVVVLDSKIRVLNENSDIIVREGDIDFFVPNSGCCLVANFDGKGIITEDELVLNATIEVDYGTGTLCADGGELSLKVIGVQTSNERMKYTIEIDGYLENRIPVVN